MSELLLSLLKHDSRTGGGGGRSVLLYLREYMSAAGVQDLHIESEDRSPFLYARIPGATSNLKGLLMFSHADTADWDEHAWSRSPLGETDLDGRIYGRGALDCKSLVAVQTHILVTLARRRVPPSRDVGLVITSHREGLLPTLTYCRPRLELLTELTERLLGKNEAIEPLHLAALFESHNGNICDCLWQLYDEYAEQKSESNTVLTQGGL